MYSGLGRCPASSSCSSVGIDIGGSGIEGGIGEGGLGSASSFVAGTAAEGKAVLFSVSRGGGFGIGWNELRRVEEPRDGGWLEDFLLLVGGVDKVLEPAGGLP